MRKSADHGHSLRVPPASPARRPVVSFVLATHNRRAVVRHALEQLALARPCGGDYEVIACDNDSTDGTPDAIGDLTTQVLRIGRNAGSCAKTFGVARAAGRFIVFLDDDSCPRPGSVERMIEHFASDPRLGAAGFTVHLPDGRREGGALPGVFLGCGVGFCAEALRESGGLDPWFFMQAEEYDLTFRLAAAGWKVAMFDDLHVEHLKTPTARRSERTTYYDTRNNLVVVARWLPEPLESFYFDDHVQRYRWLAEACGHEGAFECGLWAGLLRRSQERWAYRRRRLSAAVVETFFRLADVEARLSRLRRGGVKRIALGGFGKNIYAFHRGAALAGLQVVAIGDDRFGRSAGRAYRGTPLLPFEEAAALAPELFVMGDMSPVHAAAHARRLRERTSLSVLDWFGEADRRGESSASQRIAEENRAAMRHTIAT
jgi:GT2 family glycosyltransferase